MKTALLLLGGLLISLLGAAQPASAQLPEPRVADFNRNTWLMYFGDVRLLDKWGAHTEAQLRRTNGLRDPQQTVGRVGVNYYACKALTLTAGYAFTQTYPYGALPEIEKYPEHSLYEQVQLADTYGTAMLQHRYRLEQRWVNFPENDAATYLNRMRYQLRLTVPLFGPKIVPRMPYLTAYDELFIGFGQHVKHNVFDQNRLYAAFGYQVRKGVNLEGGYLYQLAQRRDGQVFEHNHTLQVGVTLDLDFRGHQPDFLNPADAPPLR